MPSSLLRRTPFGLVSLVVSSFPGPGSCPRDASLRPKSTGSASALPFSKLAQRSLSLRPDHSLSCSHSPFLQCLIDFVSSINPPGGSGWSVSSRVGFLISLPLEIHGFSRHTDSCGLERSTYFHYEHVMESVTTNYAYFFAEQAFLSKTARSGVARLEARFRLLPGPLTRVQRIWLLFTSMNVPRRIARERVPTDAGGAVRSYRFSSEVTSFLFARVG